MEDNRYKIGQKIKEIRKKARVTQEIFSEKINIEPSSLSNIENGKSYPSMQTVLKIMDEFRVPPEQFFDYDYLVSGEELERQIVDIIKSQPLDIKRIMYRIIKQFEV